MNLSNNLLENVYFLHSIGIAVYYLLFLVLAVWTGLDLTWD